MSIFGRGQLGIGVALNLRNNFSGPAGQVVNSMNSLSQAQQRMFSQNLQMARNMNAMGAAAGVAALRGISSWTKIGAEYGYIMASVGAVTQSTNAEMRSLDMTSRKLGKQTMFTARDVSSGMKFMGMAGMEAKSITSNIKAAVALAGATQSSLGGKGGSADIMTNVMKAFGGRPEESMRYADMLTQATLSSNTNLWDLGEALKYSSSTLRTMGYGVEDATMMAGILGNAGIQGSMAGTAMENMVRYLTKTAGEFRTKKQGAALKMLGLQPEELADTNGNLKDLKDLLKVIGGSVKSMGNIEQQQAMNEIFGVRGNRSAALLVRNLQDVDKLYEKIANGSGGRSMNILNDMMDTLHGRTLQMNSAWEDFKISFTKGLEPVLKLGAQVITKIANGLTTLFNTPFLGPFLATSVTGFILMKTVSMAFRAVVASTRLLFMNTAVSFQSMRSSVVMGYNQMTSAAYRYAAAGQAGRVSRMSSMMGMGMMGRAAATGRGGFHSVGVVGSTRAGRYFRRTPGGGARFIPAALGARYMSRYGSRVTGSAVSRGLSRGLVPLLGRALPILSRALGFLGGPIGIALAFGIPAIFSGVSSLMNKKDKALEENTDAIDRLSVFIQNTHSFDKQRFTEMAVRSGGKRYDINNAMAEKMIDAFDARMRDRDPNYNPAPNKWHKTEVFIDNEKAVEKVVTKKEDEDFFQQGFN